MLYIRKKRGEKTMEQRKKAIICLEGLGKQFQTTNGTVTALDGDRGRQCVHSVGQADPCHP